MATAQVVYDTEDGTARGALFDKLKFWIAHRTPMRSHYVDLIRVNGGEVVQLDRLADIMIADHAKKDAPPGSVSYRWVEKSLKEGQLQAPDDHLCGPPANTPRPVGSTSMPAKVSRTPFTEEDDRVLLEWVGQAFRSGAALKGNTIFQKLAQENTRHTYQSWRDRYVKKFHEGPRDPVVIYRAKYGDKPVSGTPERPSPAKKKRRTAKVVESAPATPSTLQGGRSSKAKPYAEPTHKEPSQILPQDVVDQLFNNCEDLMNLPVADYRAGWKALAESDPDHSAAELRDFFEEHVVPRWEKAQADKQNASANKKSEAPTAQSDTPPVKKETQTAIPPNDGPSSPVPEQAPQHSSEKEMSAGAPDVREAAGAGHNQPPSPSPETGGKRRKSPGYHHFVAKQKKKLEIEQPNLAFIKRTQMLHKMWTQLSDEERSKYESRAARGTGRSVTASPKKRPREGSEPIQGAKKQRTDPFKSPSKHRDVEIDATPERPLPSREKKPSKEDKPAEIILTPHIVELSSASESSDTEKDQEPTSAQQQARVLSEERELDRSRFAPTTPEGGWKSLGSSQPPSGKEEIDDEGRREAHGTVQDTQAILEGETQELDLEVPDPDDDLSESSSARSRSPDGEKAAQGDGMWETKGSQDEEPAMATDGFDSMPLDLEVPDPDSELDSTPSSRASSPDEPEQPQPRTSKLDTQAILEAETMPIDYDVPPPEDDDMLSSERSPSPAGSTASAASSFAFMDASVLHTLFEEGHGAANILSALRTTSLCDEPLARKVLRHLEAGNDIPNWKGVWTAKDDRDLESTDGDRFARVAVKHGWKGKLGVEGRMEYMKQYRSTPLYQPGMER